MFSSIKTLLFVQEIIWKTIIIWKMKKWHFCWCSIFNPDIIKFDIWFLSVNFIYFVHKSSINHVTSLDEGVKDFATTALELKTKKCDDGSRGVKNYQKLCDVIYGRSFTRSIYTHTIVHLITYLTFKELYNWLWLTVKLGYNDHGYNEHTVIANKMCCLVWFSIFYQKNFMVIANKFLRNHSYNKQNWNI